MKTHKILKSICLLATTALLTSSCSDFLDVNDNPNNPSISTPSLTLPVAEQSFTALNVTSMNYLGQFMTYNWSTPSNWSANQDLIRYNVTTTFYSNIFETSYSDIFKNLTYIENYEDETGAADYSAYQAIASTIKGFQYQYLVDLYGDIPYNAANLRSENTTPEYDDAESVYKANIDALTIAANTALDLPFNAENPGDQDIIFGGNMTNWARFANTIKLRMLIRLSNTGQDQYIQSQVVLIINNGAGYIQSNVTANPGYSDDAGKQSPFYGYIGRGPNNTEIDRNDFTVATDYIIQLLTDNNDDRLQRLYAESAAGGYKGAPQATILPGTGFTSDDLSKVGPGLIESSEQDQPIMLISESLFLQAEAVVRGYISGDAQALYESGIAESFAYLGAQSLEDTDDDEDTPDELVPSDPSEYYNQSIENVSWDASPDKIEAIITQKWFALNSTNGIEPWIELTRTGFPAGLPIPGESDGMRPVRLLYPATEVARNTGNVPALSNDAAFTLNPFWK